MASSQRKNRGVGDDRSLIARVTESPIVRQTKQGISEAGSVSKKLLWSTGRAAWIAGTTFLVLVVPLIIEMDREQQFTDLELQQASLLGSSSVSPQK